jgi:hypothetical protein
MGQRELLQQILELVCERVYFQPPSDVQMEYPAIVYNRARADTVFADNNPYRFTKQYDVTIISRNPDETIFNALAAMPMCMHERFYVADNLNHDVFTLYF